MVEVAPRATFLPIAQASWQNELASVGAPLYPAFAFLAGSGLPVLVNSTVAPHFKNPDVHATSCPAPPAVAYKRSASPAATNSSRGQKGREPR